MNDLEKDINNFLEYLDINKLLDLLEDIMPLAELYNISETNDWVRDTVGENKHRDIRLIRTVYLMSKIAEHHSGKFAMIRAKYPKLFERMEEVK